MNVERGFKRIAWLISGFGLIVMVIGLIVIIVNAISLAIRINELDRNYRSAVEHLEQLTAERVERRLERLEQPEPPLVFVLPPDVIAKAKAKPEQLERLFQPLPPDVIKANQIAKAKAEQSLTEAHMRRMRRRLVEAKRSARKDSSIDDGLKTLLVGAIGFVFVWVVFFLIRWIVRGFQGRE